jgi:hypothetical protein
MHVPSPSNFSSPPCLIISSLDHSSLDDDIEDENLAFPTPPPPPDESIELELALAP